MARRFAAYWLLLALIGAAVVASARPPQVYVTKSDGCTYFVALGLSGAMCN